MTLNKILSAAVRSINAHKEISLKKVAEFGNADLGAGVYRDAEFGEYRVIYVGDGAHLHRADDHVGDKQLAISAAQHYVEGKHAGELADTGVEPVTGHPEQTVTIVPPRPRGYHSHPSPLLKGLLMRGPQ